MNIVWTVFRKELIDALRDRRTLMMVLLSSVAIGPLVLFLFSTLSAGIERRAEAREVVVQGIQHAPLLRNYFERQTYTVRAAPADYEEQLKNKRLGDPVLVIPADFMALFMRGEVPVVELVGASGNTRAATGMARLERLLQGFSQEQATLRLAVRGVSPAALRALDVEERDLADPASRAAQIAGVVPFFVLMAVLYGALNAALDTTAGERERGSLEPLLMNPGARWALVLGKWAAVAAVGVLIAVLSCLSFLPGQWLLRSETLAAMFRFGPADAAAFIGLLLPLAGALAAVLMAIAIRCKSFKEAQANATVLVLVISLLPLATLFMQDGEKPWHLATPALAQVTLMTRVLKGEAIGAGDVLLPLVVCTLIVVIGVGYVARVLRTAAAR